MSGAQARGVYPENWGLRAKRLLEAGLLGTIETYSALFGCPGCLREDVLEHLSPEHMYKHENCVLGRWSQSSTGCSTTCLLALQVQIPKYTAFAQKAIPSLQSQRILGSGCGLIISIAHAAALGILGKAVHAHMGHSE